MPAFDDSATTAAPVEEVWKLLYDPARMVEWWEGVERVEPSGDGEITVYPDGYPDFPMPQALRTAGDGRGLTISCLVSYLVYEWRLEPLDPGTRIRVHVEIPEHERARVPAQEAVVAASLGALVELAVADEQGDRV